MVPLPLSLMCGRLPISDIKKELQFYADCEFRENTHHEGRMEDFAMTELKKIGEASQGLGAR